MTAFLNRLFAWFFMRDPEDRGDLDHDAQLDAIQKKLEALPAQSEPTAATARAIALYCATLTENQNMIPEPLRRVKDYENYILTGKLPTDA
jgi:hypothetical protein